MPIAHNRTNLLRSRWSLQTKLEVLKDKKIKNLGNLNLWICSYNLIKLTQVTIKKSPEMYLLTFPRSPDLIWILFFSSKFSNNLKN